MEGFCRGCLIKYDDPNELLEYTEKNRRLFIYSTGLQVKRNDSFTFQLCKDCYLNMKQSCKFKKLCRTSDKKFKTYLSLKEAGDNIDLCTYLKNNDDNFMLRFPHWTGSSTPANQKKDDDNESTCTSIGNFMRDILQGTEMPDSEARIIRQVIEEEADVLDESLDSHWLQDDMSIDTNFQLDFSFSPFSTPRSVSNDHCYTPKRQAEQSNGLPKVISNKPANPNKDDENEDDGKPIEIKEYDIFSDSLLDKIGDQNYGTRVRTEYFYDEKEIEKIENDLIVEDVDALSDNQINQVNSKNYYVDNTLIEQTVNDVARILGKNVVDSPTGATSILNDNNVIETQKAVASLFDGKGNKNQSDGDNMFSKSGKNQMHVESILDGKGICETQRAVASIFNGKSGKYETEISSHFSGKDIVSETQTAVVSIFDGKTGKNQAEVINIFDDNSGKNTNEISSILSGKTVNETGVVNGKSGKNLSVFGKAVRKNLNNVDNFKGGDKNQKFGKVGKACEKETDADASLLDAVNTAKQNDECAIQRRLDEALNNESQQITLEDLLGSPAAYPNTAASTPTIHNIIFGEKLDDDSNQKAGRTIEKFHDLHGESQTLDELFKNIEVKEEPTSPTPTPQPVDISKTLTINVAENSINISYNLPTQPTKKRNLIPEQDDEGIEVVDCVCTICDKKFKDMRILKLHSAKKHKVKLPRAKKKPSAVIMRICDYCGKQDTDKRNFLRHMKTHTEPKKKIRCEKCGVTFQTKAKYNKHWKTHVGHNPIQQTGDKVCCDICGREVLRKSIYHHRRNHQKQFLGHCEDCGKGYYTLADYRTHKLKHTGERPHACEVCTARFIRKSALVRHMRAHTGEKRFGCDNCNKRYSNKETLIHHIATGRCRDFKETGKLRSRQRPIRAKNTIKVFKIMTEEELAMKPFECVYCHTRHRSENVLIRHQKISKACKEIQLREVASTIIEVMNEREDPNTQQSVDLSHSKS